MDDKAYAVLDAADKWLHALNAVTGADEHQQSSISQQEELDGAEVELAAAIMHWREAGRPG